MANGAAHELPTEDNCQLTSIEKLVQANREYYHSWRALWASDGGETRSPQAQGTIDSEENQKEK